MSKRPRVLLIALGGTISAAPEEVGRSFPTRVATDLLSSVPDAASIAEVTAADVKQVPSRAVTPADMCALAHEVQNGVEEGYDGIVVTHGTDTMEETAYALALQLDVNIPVVLTGSMRPSHEPGADGVDVPRGDAGETEPGGHIGCRGRAQPVRRGGGEYDRVH